MALELIQLTQTFGSQRALDRVSLRVEQGDCYGFLGHNGAGKTTALRIALGLMRPDSGSVRVDGFDAAAWPREARARIGGLVEVPGFYGALTASQNLQLLAGLHGIERKQAAREIPGLLELVGLPYVGSKPVGAYSQGMRQRLGLAQAMLGGPDYLLLDEPTNGLDPEGIAELRSLLLRLTREKGVTVMLSSHQLSEISDICNRVSLLRQGKLLVEAETRSLLAAEGRYLLQTAADCSELLRKLQIPSERVADGWQLSMGETTPDDLAGAVVEARLGLRSLAPSPPTLEEIYLQYTRGEKRAAAAPESAQVVSADSGAAAPTAPAAPAEGEGAGTPSPRKAPRLPTWRVFKYETRRALLSPKLWAMLALPALLAGLAVFLHHVRSQGYLEEVGRKIFSTSRVTAFEGLGIGLSGGLPLAVLIAVALASQSLAGDLRRGTLRNILLRPVRRGQVGLGKCLAICAQTLICYLLVVGASLVMAASLFDFRDVVEILPNGGEFPLVSAQELWPELWSVLLAPLPGLFAFAGLGFAAGAMVRSPAAALGLGLGFMGGSDLARALARSFRWEYLLPTAYVPSPLGDVSHIQYYVNVSQGVANARFEYAATAVVVPLVWGVLSFALGTFLLSRRPVS